MSIRLRLTLLNGLVLLVALGLFAGVSYASQARSLQSSLDTTLREEARRLRDVPPFWLERGFDRSGDTTPNPFRRLPAGPGRISPDLFLQITDSDGNIMARSRSLEDGSLPINPEILRRAMAGEEWLGDGELEGQPVRLIVAPLGLGRPGSNRGPAGVVERPIDWLAATAHAIGAAQDFGRRVPTGAGKRRDEVGRLTDEFNGMLARLQSAYEQLEATLSAQRRFIADASHELRTPLTSV
jgi:signal transduction histidine kinase